MRKRAPWALWTPNNDNGQPDTSKSQTYWPLSACEGLEEARAKLTEENTEDIWHSSEIKKQRMVCFVDELVHHTTPLVQKRETWVDDLHFDTFSTSDVRQGFSVQPIESPPTLKRQMSGDLDKEEKASAFKKLFMTPVPYSSGGMTDGRKFSRVWISIVPKDWYSDYDYTPPTD